MNRVITEERLALETQMHRGTGAVSAGNRSLSFRPVFTDTSAVDAPRFSDGRPSPFHLIDGLPDQLVATRDAVAWAVALEGSVIAGLVRAGRLCSGEEAGRLAGDEMARACA